MSTRRTIIIIASLVLGLVASVGAYGYLNSAQERAYVDATLVKVFKVKKDIPKGATGDQAISEERVSPDEMPQEYRPGNAVTSLDAIRGKVAQTQLSANQVIVEGMFVDPRTAQVTAAERIPAGQVAVTVSLDKVSSVAGLLVPGDKVNIMLVINDGPDTPGGLVTHLFQNVNILFIGETAAPEVGETEEIQNPGSDLITFAVPPLAAERITAAANAKDGKIVLTLVPPDNKPAPIPPVSEGNLLGGGLTPYEG